MAGPEDPRRVLLVDDHAVFRTSAAAWLAHEGHDVVGSCSSDAEAGLDAHVRDAPVVGFIATRNLTWSAIDALR